MKLSANITGTDALLKKLKNFGQEGERKFEQITKVAAEEIKETAKQRVVVGKYQGGSLRQSITSEPKDKLNYRIYTAESYAAYVEFGTGGLVDIPKGWESLAARFKGKGIKQINLPARPYMYPAFKQGSKQYIKDLDKAIERLTIKYNKK